MPEIVGLLTENEQPIVRKVFRTPQRRLREQNGLSLGYLWRSTLRDCRAQVGLGTQDVRHSVRRRKLLRPLRRGRAADRTVAGGAAAGRAGLRGRRRRRIWQIGEIWYRTCGISALGLLVILVLI